MKTGPVEARQGDNLTYEIKIENIGGSRADNVTLYDDLPVGLTYTGSAPVGTPVGGGVSWNLGSLESGDNHHGTDKCERRLYAAAEDAGDGYGHG